MGYGQHGLAPVPRRNGRMGLRGGYRGLPRRGDPWACVMDARAQLQGCGSAAAGHVHVCHAALERWTAASAAGVRLEGWLLHGRHAGWHLQGETDGG